MSFKSSCYQWLLRRIKGGQSSLFTPTAWYNSECCLFGCHGAKAAKQTLKQPSSETLELFGRPLSIITISEIGEDMGIQYVKVHLEQLGAQSTHTQTICQEGFDLESQGCPWHRWSLPSPLSVVSCCCLFSRCFTTTVCYCAHPFLSDSLFWLFLAVTVPLFSSPYMPCAVFTPLHIFVKPCILYHAPIWLN